MVRDFGLVIAFNYERTIIVDSSQVPTNYGETAFLTAIAPLKPDNNGASIKVWSDGAYFGEYNQQTSCLRIPLCGYIELKTNSITLTGLSMGFIRERE